MYIHTYISSLNHINFYKLLSPSSNRSAAMDKCRQKQSKIRKFTQLCEEVSSIEWEFVNMSEQEEDIINRMHKLVGDKWGLIAGRIPGRKAEEIERFWLMRNSDNFTDKRREYYRRQKV